MLTETTIVDKIEIVGEFRQVGVRTATVILRDGEEVTRTYHRSVIAPGDDYSKESEEVRAVCSSLHTPELVSKYAAFTKGTVAQ
jgi:hypothetical protein